MGRLHSRIWLRLPSLSCRTCANSTAKTSLGQPWEQWRGAFRPLCSNGKVKSTGQSIVIRWRTSSIKRMISCRFSLRNWNAISRNMTRCGSTSTVVRRRRREKMMIVRRVYRLPIRRSWSTRSRWSRRSCSSCCRGRRTDWI